MEASDEGTVSHAGSIPEAYVPSEGVELFTKKWWAEITAKDDFWMDLASMVSKTVLKKRIKQNIVIGVDLRTRARKKEEERLAREKGRAQALKVARLSKEQDEPASSRASLTKSPRNTIATGDTASFPSVVPAFSWKGMGDISYD